MIAFLKSWCEGIIVAVMVSILMEALLPEGNHKKYVKVVIGIYLIFTILNPFLGKLNSNFVMNHDFEMASIETSSQVDMKNIQELYKNGMKETLKNRIEEEFACHIVKLEITYDENYENIQTIYLKIQESEVSEVEKVEIGKEAEKQESSQNYEKIKEYITENYEVEPSKIFIN